MTFKEYLSIYLHELLEATIAVIIIKYILNKSMTYKEMITIIFIIGTVTFILENYDQDYKSNISQGIKFTIGSAIITKYI